MVVSSNGSISFLTAGVIIKLRKVSLPLLTQWPVFPSVTACTHKQSSKQKKKEDENELFSVEFTSSPEMYIVGKHW